MRIAPSVLLILVTFHQPAWAGSPTFAEDPMNTLPFRHVSPISAERHIHLFMGSGLGWVDFDRDGCFDLICCQGAPVNSAPLKDAPPALRLCRGSGHRFTDQSAAAGFTGTAYAFGLTIGDFDNDGFPDVFVTGLFSAALYFNNGDGTFTNRTQAAGIAPRGFGAGCCWTDFDNDGCLDLLYIRYIAIPANRYPLCTVPYQGKTVAISCNPRKLSGEPDSLYRSLGDGTFTDVTTSSGLAATPPRPGLGCAAADLNDDGTVELYVANDSAPNELWIPAGANRFQEHGFLAGVAVNRNGASEAGMGVAVGDVDGDLRPDLYVTNFFNETNTLYRNEGGLAFLDVTEAVGIAAPSRQRLGFGVTLADFDNDGWPDFLVANGHVQDQLDKVGIVNEPFAQVSQVLQNRSGRFTDVSRNVGPFFREPHVSRGTAAADINGDGRIDVAVLRLNDQASLLSNTTTDLGHWMGIELQGTTSNRDGIGATVIVRAEGRGWRRDRMSSASYLSCDSPVLHFGLADQVRIDTVTVRWPGGTEEQFTSTPVDSVSRLVEGTGSPMKVTVKSTQ